MNILLVSQMESKSGTGVTTYYLTLQEEFVKKGHKVSIITPESTPVHISILLKLYRRIMHLLPFNITKLVVSESSYYTSIYFALKKIKKQEKWDVVHGQDPCSSCAAANVFKGKIPILTTCHFNDNPVVERQLKYKLSSKQTAWIVKWFKFLFSKSSNYIFVSNYTYEKSKHLLHQPANYQIIPNGVDFQSPGHNYAGEPFTITNLGTIEERKNQILLIQSAKILVDKGFNFKIHLLGIGPKLKEWEKVVNEEQLSRYVIFLGFRRDRLDVMLKSHLYIHTSLNESWGLAITEALSIGLPVLALDCGGISEQFPASRIGLLSPTITPQELAEKIIRYSSTDQLKYLAIEQYSYASTRFTLEIMANRTLSAYRNVTTNRQV